MDPTGEIGTTPNLQQIVTGRCYEYVTLVKPSSRFNCDVIWMEFERAIFKRSSCSVRMNDYKGIFRATAQILPCDKLLFWSKTRDIIHNYVAVTQSFWTLENTLVGYMFNDLIWCGQPERDRGFDYHSCPDWSTCLNHPALSLWKQASQNFAAAACGNITVLLNGSIHQAFNKTSMFGSVEVDNLNQRMVSHVHIKVIYNLDGPYVESCTRGSILELIKVLKTRGFHWTCTENDPTLVILQCLKNPRWASCQSVPAVY
ncbi:ADP-ribosyl cyclase/cyclic ADP-ribose hydrolase 1 [Triplophysa dalaica]|uniref:ADP-ribosyl cyclase/cyclic ADP-ribose hydrolase 1 n=1 Tax=Triplophysa dalaica TaxID=1582913 RepID=UPI0024DFFFB0|nr:ADP-ribosyl cyclase/cyclic ADP-ribose hydrolase 1 [Triplophysa dalaica]